MQNNFSHVGETLGGLSESLGLCESPIEVKIAKHLREWGVKIQPQRPIGKYRADIYIEMDGKKIVVECDGKEYHSSKEQRERDSVRDSYMRGIGIDVIRFTGAQISRNIEQCVIRVVEELSSIYQSKRFQSYLASYLDSQTEKEMLLTEDEYLNKLYFQDYS